METWAIDSGLAPIAGDPTLDDDGVIKMTTRDAAEAPGTYSLPVSAPLESDVVAALGAALAPAFLLVRELGAGGMGRVYLARDPRLKRFVAVKLLAPDLARDVEARQRFQREAQAVAAINHPNVINIFGVGELADGTPYIVMEYISGRSIADRLKADGPMPVAEAVRVLADVAAALAEAHRQGIIHRDIKPGNILIDEETGRAEVTDFGIAAVRRHDEEDAEHLTQTGTSIGTPAYMSPEQILAENVSEKTDVYNLGLLAYELLSAQGPYDISSPRELIAAHLRDVPARLSARCAEVDPELEALAASCLEKDPTMRPTAADVAERLAKGDEGVLEWPPPGLEKLQGGLRWATEHLALGSLLLVGPLIIAIAFERGTVWRNIAPRSALLGLVSGLGLALFAGALVRLAVMLRKAARASGVGYGWGTIFEVLSDDRGDGGALVAGSREYAAVPGRERDRLRLLRHVRADLWFLAGVSPVIGLYVALAGASGGKRGPSGVVLWTLGPMALLYLASRAVAGYEQFKLRKARAARTRRRALGGTSSALISAWNESFERARTGQRLGMGRVGGRRRLIAIISGGLLLIGVLGITTYTLSLIGLVGEAAWGVIVPSLPATTDRVARAKRLAPYRSAIDSSTTPLAAGEALNVIFWYGRTSAAAPSERAPVRRYAADWVMPVDTSNLFGPRTTRWQAAAISQAARGLTSAQRRFLESAAAFPAAAEFTLAAGARAASTGSAMYRVPLPPGTRFWSLPIPRYNTIQAAAYAHQARAALNLADGRVAQAEAKLREVISVGLLLVDGTMLIENLTGASMVIRAGSVLEAFYVATGRGALAQQVAAAPESVADESGLASLPTSGNSADPMSVVHLTLSDTSSPRGLRWEFFVVTSMFEPCTDLHQLIFGPSPEQDQHLSRLRRDLVRWPIDAEIFRLIEGGYHASPEFIEANAPRSFGRLVGRRLDGLLGGRRFETCAAVAHLLFADAI